jgi:hypothetical protein
LLVQHRSSSNGPFLDSKTSSSIEGKTSTEIVWLAACRVTQVRMDVDKSSSHHLFRFEIAGDKPCSQQLSGMCTVLRYQADYFRERRDQGTIAKGPSGLRSRFAEQLLTRSELVGD